MAGQKNQNIKGFFLGAVCGLSILGSCRNMFQHVLKKCVDSEAIKSSATGELFIFSGDKWKRAKSYTVDL